MFIQRVVKSELLTAVESERLKTFMLEIIPHFIGGFITCFVLCYTFNANGQGSSIWFTAMALNAVLITLLYAAYFLLRDKISATFWKWPLLFSISCFAAFLALSPHVLLPQTDGAYLNALIIIMIAMCLAPVSVMALYIESFYAYISIPIFSVIVRMASDQVSPYLIFLVFFFWSTCIIAGWRIFKLNILGIQYKLQVEKAQQSAEKANQAKSHFLAVASHDIRQPLQAIELFSNALSERHQLQADPTMGKLQSSINNISDFLDSLLDISRLEAKNIQPKPEHLFSDQQLQQLADQYKALCRHKGIDLYTRCAHNVMYVDPVLFNRVISNLLNNAVNYTDQGAITLSTRQHEDWLTVSVQDTGIGIPQDQLQDIFTEFHQLQEHDTTHKHGLGLGLSIVQRLCLLQDWKVEVSSVPGEGSCFSITVPLGNQQLISAAEKKAPGYNAFQGKQIVILDNEQSIRQALTELLTQWGANAHSFETPEAAIAFTREQSVDLIISDLHLNDGKKGTDAISAIHQQSRSPIPSLLVTGDTNPATLQTAQQQGLLILHKPVRAAQLRIACHRLLQNTI